MSALAQLISVEDAHRVILERAKGRAGERVPIERAAGRVLAEAVSALVDLPPFSSSAMDGYAVRAVDTTGAPVRLPVVARIAAGSPAERALGSGEAMAIPTGAAVRAGAAAGITL